MAIAGKPSRPSSLAQNGPLTAADGRNLRLKSLNPVSRYRTKLSSKGTTRKTRGAQGLFSAGLHFPLPFTDTIFSVARAFARGRRRAGYRVLAVGDVAMLVAKLVGLSGEVRRR